MNTIIQSLFNIPGWRTNRKIVVIESDDWGSIRMPSKNTYEILQNRGYNPSKDPYLKYDSLASEDDLEALFNVLLSVKDKNQNSARITANCVVANPDFDKIFGSNFEEYHFELFTETLKKYTDHQKSFKLWTQGIESKLFHPQFHGREHLNIYQWMKGLKSGDKILREAFNHHMISISSVKSEMRFGYMESLDFYSLPEKVEKNDIINEGLIIFRNLFGYRSTSFIANCYVWFNQIEKVLKENGVEYIQSNRFQLEPTLKNRGHRLMKKFHYTGQKNKYNQIYLVRNIHFEPSQRIYKDDVGECLKRINIAFKLRKPAIISSHRLNFIGSIDPENSKRNLLLLKELLTQIKKLWPDVEFLSSDELGRLITKRP